MRRLFEKELMFLRLRRRVLGERGIMNKILEYANHPQQDIRLANELVRLDPIFAALSSLHVHWPAFPFVLPN